MRLSQPAARERSALSGPQRNCPWAPVSACPSGKAAATRGCWQLRRSQRRLFAVPRRCSLQSSLGRPRLLPVALTHLPVLGSASGVDRVMSRHILAKTARSTRVTWALELEFQQSLIGICRDGRAQAARSTAPPAPVRSTGFPGA